ncbi:MAG: hypothetical protein ABSG76_27630 [Xanthobacteraceae bacterium]
MTPRANAAEDEITPRDDPVVLGYVELLDEERTEKEGVTVELPGERPAVHRADGKGLRLEECGPFFVRQEVEQGEDIGVREHIQHARNDAFSPAVGGEPVVHQGNLHR